MPFTGCGTILTDGLPPLVLVPPTSSEASMPMPASLWFLVPSGLIDVTLAVATSTMATALFSCRVT